MQSIFVKEQLLPGNIDRLLRIERSNMHVNCEDAQRQTALIRFAAIATGLQAASNETRAAALSDAIRHSVTYTECIREGLLLRILGSGIAASANRDLFPVPSDSLSKAGGTASEEIAA
jgi:hypothetical protein